MLGVNLRASDSAQIFLGFSKVLKPQFLGASWQIECWGFLDTPKARRPKAGQGLVQQKFPKKMQLTFKS